jgi:hypothetical protein
VEILKLEIGGRFRSLSFFEEVLTMAISFPVSTQGASRLLGVPEHCLRHLLRAGHVSPPLVLGRFQWHRSHVEAAADRLDRTLTLKRKLEGQVENGTQG